MRASFRFLTAFLPALLLLTGCVSARRSSTSPAPEPVFDDHRVQPTHLATWMIHQAQARAMADSAIMRLIRAHVDEWNQGNLEGFLALYDREAAYVRGSGFSDAREAVRRIHTERWFRDGGGPSARLSARLLRTETLTDEGTRLLILAWTAIDVATGREQTWISELTFRAFPDSDWRIIHEEPSPEGAGGSGGTR